MLNEILTELNYFNKTLESSFREEYLRNPKKTIFLMNDFSLPSYDCVSFRYGVINMGERIKVLRKKVGIGLGVIGLIMIIAGLAIGYIDVALFGLFISFMGQAIILQEHKRLG